MTLIAATLAGHRSLFQRVKTAKRLGADIIELRIDTFTKNVLFNPETLAKLIRNVSKLSTLPLIATIRSHREQGNHVPRPSILSEPERLELFKIAIPLIHYVDIELSAKKINRKVIQLAHAANKQVIVSYHNFRFTPPDAMLNKIAKECAALGADIVKIACMAKTEDDAVRILELARSFKQKPVACISMGKWSGIARIAGSLFGSRLTYARVGKPTAPGQPTLKQLKNTVNSLQSSEFRKQ